MIITKVILSYFLVNYEFFYLRIYILYIREEEYTKVRTLKGEDRPVQRLSGLPYLHKSRDLILFRLNDCTINKNSY